MDTNRMNNRTPLSKQSSHLTGSDTLWSLKHGDRTMVTGLETKGRVREEVLLAYYIFTLRLLYTDIDNKLAFLPLIASFSIHLHHCQFTNR